MKTYQIHLIRHGLTDENEKGKYIGSTDVPLSQKGIKLLKKYSEEYDYPGAPIVYSSPLQRCVQTAGILYPAITPKIIGGLAECSFGDWEGKTGADLAKEDTVPEIPERDEILPGEKLYLKISTEDSAAFRKTKAVLNMFPGNTPAVLYFADTKLRRGTRCALYRDMVTELKKILGEDSVVLK